MSSVSAEKRGRKSRKELNEVGVGGDMESKSTRLQRREKFKNTPPKCLIRVLRVHEEVSAGTQKRISQQSYQVRREKRRGEARPRRHL